MDPRTLKGFHRLQQLRMENDERRFSMEEERPRFERIANRHENGTAPRAVTAYQLFQTPAALAQQIAARLNIQPGARLLEPSAGLGRILDAISARTRDPFPTHFPEVVAVEIAPECAQELYRQDRPGVRILQRDFLSVSPDELGLFDGIAMNPPFHMRSDIAHIKHALRFLKPGGTLAAVCMDTRTRHEAFSVAPFTYEPLPPHTFRESGTETPTALITYRNA